MGDVIELRNAGWRTGEARCLGCGHEFVTMIPQGPTVFECPRCRVHKAVLTHLGRPNRKDKTHTCKCGNELFFITNRGLFCPVCGLYSNLMGAEEKGMIHKQKSFLAHLARILWPYRPNQRQPDTRRERRQAKRGRFEG